MKRSKQLDTPFFLVPPNRYSPTKGVCYSKEALINHYMKESNREFRTHNSSAYRIPGHLPRAWFH